jgi:hypothetical protein
VFVKFWDYQRSIGAEPGTDRLVVLNRLLKKCAVKDDKNKYIDFLSIIAMLSLH